jgi:hypothetical protein
MIDQKVHQNHSRAGSAFALQEMKCEFDLLQCCVQNPWGLVSKVYSPKTFKMVVM